MLAARGRAFVVACSLLCILGGASLPAHAAIADKLKDGLRASSTKVRIIAIASVARTRDPEARALLEPMLRDVEAPVRAAAADGLAQVGDVVALPAIEMLASDPDVSVRSVAARAAASLRARLVYVDVGTVEDVSNSGIVGLAAALQNTLDKELRSALGPPVVVQRGGVDKGWGLMVRVRSVTKSKRGGDGILDVKCEMTVVELPGKALRLSLTANAAAGVEGDIPRGMERELALDGINACGPSLASDFVSYLRDRLSKAAAK